MKKGWIVVSMAVELIVNGWTQIFVGLAARAAGQRMPAPG